MYSDYENDYNLHGNGMLSDESGNAPGGYSYDRQDSLALAASLQEKDRIMESFMDEEIDIRGFIDREGMAFGADMFADSKDEMSDYLRHMSPQTSKDFGVTNFKYEPEQPQSCMVHSFADAFTENEDATEFPAVNYDYTNQAPPHNFLPTPVSVPMQIKQEVTDYEEEKPTGDIARSVRRARTVRLESVEHEVFTPKTRARRYVLKNDKEKSTDEYRLKRAKNNDAVRKSRCKQKSEQQKCIDEKNVLSQENQQLKTQNSNLLQEVHKLKKILDQKDEQIKQLSSY